MTKTLYLLRHAKSSWTDASLSDAARPLNQRGRKAGKRIGKELARRGWLPDLVLCSSAMRARETFARLAKGVEKISPGTVPPVTYEDDLYLASSDTLIERVRMLDGALASALILGHNTGLQDFALALPRPSGAAYARVEQKFPTGALAVISFETDHWRDIAPGSGALQAVIYPKDLTAKG